MLRNRSGLHARPASLFSRFASRFKSAIVICKNDRCVDAKNVLQVLTLAADHGDKIVVKVDGEDEDVALSEIIMLLTDILPKEDV